MNQSSGAAKTNTPTRVIVIDATVGNRLWPLALAWASLGQNLALIGPVEGAPDDFALAMLDLQLAIERAGGICMALEANASDNSLHGVLERIVDALGGIDMIVTADEERAKTLLVAMDGLPRRVRPGWILTGIASMDDLPSGVLKGSRVTWVMDGQGETNSVARLALECGGSR